MNTLSAYKNEINALCANHKVRSLYAFGSVLTPNFNTNSDIDLIVDFKEIDVKDYADNYFEFKFSLQDIFNRPVDLLEEQAIKNPYFKQQSIVDLDIRTKGIKLEKRPFMNLEITLYVDKQFDVKSKEIKNNVKDILSMVIEDGLSDKNLFNFYKSKK